MAHSRTQLFELGEEKKHSVRYEEIGDPKESDSEAIANSLTGTIYVRKGFLGSKPYPKKLRMTLEVIE
jgi:hypothetical protein